MARGVAAICCSVLLAPSLSRTASTQTPLGTSFTYQGRLAESGSPADGTYDFRFLLYDAPVGGNQVGPIVTRDDVFVSTGLFTVGIDFGASFTDQRRYLEVAVRPGASTGAYDTVSGRHELTAAPSALFGASTPWAGVTGKPAGFADNLDNDVLGALVCGVNQVVKWNGSNWLCATDIDTNTLYTAGVGGGLMLSGTAFSVAPLGITNARLADSSVTSAKILDNSITASDIAANAVTRSELSGSEVPLYQSIPACGSSALTFNATCTTTQCSPTNFFTCSLSCTASSPVTCSTTLRGYLLSPTIP